MDAGDPEVGKRLIKQKDTFCPVCPNSKMLKMVDPEQPHIYFESCLTCYGRYNGAGDLKHLAEKTTMDFYPYAACRG